MKQEKKTDFRQKHPENALPEAAIQAQIQKRLKGGDLPCALAFAIAKDTGHLPGDVGRAADLMGIRLSKCQLGLFGYKPDKKIVTAAESVEAALQEAVSGSLKDGKLPCEAAWRIADTLEISKMAVSAACEAMKIKVSACQLGAF